MFPCFNDWFLISTSMICACDLDNLFFTHSKVLNNNRVVAESETLFSVNRSYSDPILSISPLKTSLEYSQNDLKWSSHNILEDPGVVKRKYNNKKTNKRTGYLRNQRLRNFCLKQQRKTFLLLFVLLLLCSLNAWGWVEICAHFNSCFILKFVRSFWISLFYLMLFFVHFLFFLLLVFFCFFLF